MKECGVPEDFLEKEELLVWQDSLEQEGNRDLLVQMGHLANLALRDLLATRVQLV